MRRKDKKKESLVGLSLVVGPLPIGGPCSFRNAARAYQLFMIEPFDLFDAGILVGPRGKRLDDEKIDKIPSPPAVRPEKRLPIKVFRRLKGLHSRRRDPDGNIFARRLHGHFAGGRWGW